MGENIAKTLLGITWVSPGHRWASLPYGGQAHQVNQRDTKQRTDKRIGNPFNAGWQEVPLRGEIRGNKPDAVDAM
jgi:hypothetical protein